MKAKKIILLGKCFNLLSSIMWLHLNMNTERLSWVIENKEAVKNDKFEITNEELYRELLWQWGKKYTPKPVSDNIPNQIWFTKDKWDSL